MDHFFLEGVPKRTTYNVLKCKRVVRKPGSGKKTAIMNKKGLKRLFKNKDGISQNEAAKVFECSQQHICKLLKKLGIQCRKKQKSPAYTQSEILRFKANCRWMTRNYIEKNFILDDESYFSLSKTQMPGNDIYYTIDPKTADESVKFEFKKNTSPR